MASYIALLNPQGQNMAGAGGPIWILPTRAQWATASVLAPGHCGPSGSFPATRIRMPPSPGASTRGYDPSHLFVKTRLF
jgi:hypothetical protein